jgi:hypothetical protein
MDAYRPLAEAWRRLCAGSSGRFEKRPVAARKGMPEVREMARRASRREEAGHGDA